MSRREFESLLDQCLNRIDSELEPCLPDDPEQVERVHGCAPIDPAVAPGGDAGTPIVVEQPDGPTAAAAA